MQLLTIILLALTLSITIVNLVVLRWIYKDIDDKCNAINNHISITREYLSADLQDEAEKTREYLKAEIIKSENDYVYYEPTEETKDS